MTFKRDQYLLEQANKLDADYLRAHMRDLEFQVDYLTGVLRNLYDNVQSDVLEDNWSKHLNTSMNDAAEALGIGE